MSLNLGMQVRSGSNFLTVYPTHRFPRSQVAPRLTGFILQVSSCPVDNASKRKATHLIKYLDFRPIQSIYTMKIVFICMYRPFL